MNIFPKKKIMNTTTSNIKITNINKKKEITFDIGIYKLFNNVTFKNEVGVDEINDIKTKNMICSLEEILSNLPLNFDINSYKTNYNLLGNNKYEIIYHYIKNNRTKSVTYMENIGGNNNIKTFLFVFPQYHEIEENNKFWGKGFTEWTNFSKTYKPIDEYDILHPHSDIGQYNILDYSTRKRWNDYIEKYDFYGIIYCHYFFEGKIVMNKPLDKILEDGQPDKPWALNWINENWTRRWDGGNKDVLLNINYDLQYTSDHFDHLLKYFNHKNYIKINNKPLLGIYIANSIPQYYIDKLIELSIKNGFSGVSFINFLNCEFDYEKVNNNIFWDFEIEYYPNYLNSINERNYSHKNPKNNIYTFNIRDSFYKLLITTPTKNINYIRGCFPSWSNFPRHTSLKSPCLIYNNANSFDFFLVLLKQFHMIKQEKGEYFFINALNEWGEQCVMEPSIEYEYSFLNAHKYAKNFNFDNLNIELLDELIYHI